MDRTRRLLVGIALSGWTMAASADASPSGQPAVADGTAASQPATPAEAIKGILTAPDPSATITAYSQAAATGADPAEVERTYIRRMVEFGLPEMADAQARDLVARDPSSGLAQAVAAYMSGKRSETNEALSRITIAARLQPDDPFIQRTAGQLVAWYDTSADRSAVPDETKAAVEAMRASLAYRSTYAAAYTAARDAYIAAGQPADAQVQAGAVAGAAPADTSSAAAVPFATTYNTYNTYTPAPVYADGGATYVYTDDVYHPWYPTYYSPGCSWWPAFSSVIVIDVAHHHHGNHWDGHHDGHWDGHSDGHSRPGAPGAVVPPSPRPTPLGSPAPPPPPAVLPPRPVMSKSVASPPAAPAPTPHMSKQMAPPPTAVPALALPPPTPAPVRTAPPRLKEQRAATAAPSPTPHMSKQMAPPPTAVPAPALPPPTPAPVRTSPPRLKEQRAAAASMPTPVPMPHAAPTASAPRPAMSKPAPPPPSHPATKAPAQASTGRSKSDRSGR